MASPTLSTSWQNLRDTHETAATPDLWAGSIKVLSPQPLPSQMSARPPSKVLAWPVRSTATQNGLSHRKQSPPREARERLRPTGRVVSPPVGVPIDGDAERGCRGPRPVDQDRRPPNPADLPAAVRADRWIVVPAGPGEGNAGSAAASNRRVRDLQCPGPARQGAYTAKVKRSLVQRVHNPHNRECGCDPDCWCRRTALGRAVRWWFPGRHFGLHHKRPGSAEWKRNQASPPND